MGILEQLKRDEGCILHAYQDSRGFWTIGYGRLIDKNGGQISQAEADYLLANDIQRAKDTLFEALPWAEGLDDARQGVLVNMCFNMGIRGLVKFKETLGAIQQGLYKLAAQHMLESLWAKQVGSRAIRLANQMETGTWQ